MKVVLAAAALPLQHLLCPRRRRPNSQEAWPSVLSATTTITTALLIAPTVARGLVPSAPSDTD